ncbi:20S proteasome subunit alpha 2 [Nematocida homosporus]|uniref:20S proteasome subunit alpha 2 n=1 Tax=Nematocida homosporus TaxID=1912981 RepID=UPI00221FA495|nr:20S proteasome subunit alpha 2 [Nematocida homosporus]KAI5186665.1 20S proteasome subunit alpha 2 [Nematocida homosporus]
MNSEIKYSITTFSSKGTLAQCERALTAATKGAPALGIRASNGLVLASLKRTPSLLVDKNRIKKVFKVCDAIIGTFAGLSGDFRLVLETAREIAVDYYKIYGRFPYVDAFIKEFSKVVQEKTQKGGLRPVGCICLFGGFAPIRKEIEADDEGRVVITELDREKMQPLLYQIDPSGSIKCVFSAGVGKYYKESSQFLANRCNAETEIYDAVSIAILALNENAETALTEEDMDLCTITREGIKMYTAQEIKEVIDSSRTHH